MNLINVYRDTVAVGDKTPIYTWELRLRLLGIKKGIFCREANINNVAFSRWLNGHIKPCLESFIMVEEALERLELNNFAV